VDSKMGTTWPIRWMQMHPSKQLGAETIRSTGSAP